MSPSAVTSDISVTHDAWENNVLNGNTTVSSEQSSKQNGDHSSAYGHKNPSLQVTADHTIKIEEAPVGHPGRGEVLLHVKTTGICG